MDGIKARDREEAGIGKEGAWIIAGAVGSPERSKDWRVEDKRFQAWNLCTSPSAPGATGSSKPDSHT